MEVTLHLKSDNHLIKVIIDEDDGSRSEKEITKETFSGIFKTEEKKEYFYKSQFFNSICEVESVDGLLYGSNTKKVLNGVFFLPADKRYMNVFGEKSLMPYPSLIFCFQAKAGVLINSKCYAVKEKHIEKLKPELMLYNFPYGNVNTCDQHICWGNNQIAKLYEFEDLRKLIGTFFYSESNKDYVVTGESFPKKHKNYEAFLKFIKNKEQFPDSSLVRCKNGYTLKDVFMNIYRK